LEARVSWLEEYRRWKLMEDVEPNWLVTRLTTDETTEKMLAGTAFHKAFETADAREHNVLTANGYRFDILCEAEICLPQLQEVTLTKPYGELLVRGTLDGLGGAVVTELKTTGQFDPDRYMESLQWRFYLDLSEADRFDYHVFVTNECGEKHYEVYQYHQLTQFRYPKLHSDCQDAADEYRLFAERFLA
jgi:hypothetical protein